MVSGKGDYWRLLEQGVCHSREVGRFAFYLSIITAEQYKPRWDKNQGMRPCDSNSKFESVRHLALNLARKYLEQEHD